MVGVTAFREIKGKDKKKKTFSFMKGWISCSVRRHVKPITEKQGMSVFCAIEKIEKQSFDTVFFHFGSVF